MALRVGITGGIGSGKSIICSIFKCLGIPVFEADLEAKKLINISPDIRSGLIDLFGSDIYDHNDTIDRKKLAGIIFNDKSLLEQVNLLVHPVVRKEFLLWSDAQEAPYVLHEAAILFESGFYKMMDYTLLVTAPEELRIQRVMDREQTSEMQVRERIAKQWSDEHKETLADIVIKNDNGELIIPQIIHIDKQLKEYGKIW